MLCRLDIRKSVLDDIFEKFITGRYTFRQTSPETIVLLAKEGGRGKITSRPQAWKVAQELRKRIVQNYQGGVLVHIIEGDNSQPISLRFGVTPKYIDYLEKAAPKTLFNATPRIYNTGEIRYTLKSVEVLQSDKAKEIFNKGRKNNWTLDKILSELQIPKEQKELIKQIEQDFVQKQFAIYNEPVQYALELASKYSFSVEINTAKTNRNLDDSPNAGDLFNYGNDSYTRTNGGNDFKLNGKSISEDKLPDFVKNYFEETKVQNQLLNTQHYSNLTVPGGIAYTENEIATPLIIPSIKGHAQFSTDNGIGWFRSDEQTNNSENQTENLLNEAINGNNKVYSELANVLKNHYNLHKSVTTKIVDFLKDFFGKILNGNFGNNIIELVKNLGKDNIRIFLHESIHGITSEKLAIYRGGDLSRLTQKEINAIKELERIFEKIKIELLSLKNSRGNNIFSKAVIDSHYGFTNLDEFLAEAFTNREFQSLLSNIKGEGRKPNIFKQLLNVISDLLGLNDSTILDDIFALTEEFAGNNNQNAATKTRRILEVQSDLFQKGRDKQTLTSGNFVGSDGKTYIIKWTNDNEFRIVDNQNNLLYNNVTKSWYETPPKDVIDRIKNITKDKENQFLQLLNKDNNWVTFFIKSIIQDSAKKGYEKVLFPRIDNIIQIESAGKWKTYEEAEKAMKNEDWYEKDKNLRKILDAALNRPKEEQNLEHILRLKEQIASHQPSLLNTAKFYENDVTNILNKTYGKVQDYSNTPVKSGVDNLFEENKELAKIGNKQLYSAYLNTIFPDSKVKDIVYHGSNSKIEKFDTSKSKVSDVIYFSNDIREAKYYATKIPNNGIFVVGDYQYTYLRFEDKNYYLKKEVKIGKETLSKQEAISKYAVSENEYEEAKSKLGNLNPSLINIKNLYQGFGEDLFFGGVDYFKEKGFDGFITNNDSGGATILAVFEPEQIYILGSKQDIEGFKDFVKESSKPKVTQITDEYDNTWNEVVIPYIPTPQDLVTDRTIDDLTPQQLNMFEEFYKNNQNATQEDALEYFLKCKL